MNCILLKLINGFKTYSRACRYGNMKVFYALLERGAVLSARNKSGSTPLHLASLYGRMEIIQVRKIYFGFYIDFDL